MKHRAAGLSWGHAAVPAAVAAGVVIGALIVGRPMLNSGPRSATGTNEARPAYRPPDAATLGRMLERADAAAAQHRHLEATRMYRRVLDHAPDHFEARAALQAIGEASRLPMKSDVLERTHHLLDSKFLVHETRRFVVLSNADPRWTRMQAERLERAYHQYHRFCHRLALDPLPIEHKLVCVLFENREQFERFARKHDNVANPSLSGYYSPTNDRVVFYNIHTDANLESARQQVDQMRQTMDNLAAAADEAARRGEADRAQALQRDVARYRDHIRDESSRLDEFAEQVSAATTIHEAVHQLLFHTRVQHPAVGYPIWVSEGLATIFETDAPGSAFGPDHEYAPRRTAFQALLAGDQLVPLHELVAVQSLGEVRATQVASVYHQSYALVTWLSRFRRDEFRAYLQSVRSEPPGVLSEQRHQRLFEAAFGSIDQVEHDWLSHERALFDRSHVVPGS